MSLFGAHREQILADVRKMIEEAQADIPRLVSEELDKRAAAQKVSSPKKRTTAPQVGGERKPQVPPNLGKGGPITGPGSE